MKDIHAIIQDRFYLSIKVHFISNLFNIYSIIVKPRKENPKGRNKEEEEKD
jgi:hypothetical protein